MDPKKIERINELAHKAKTQGLNKEEQAERHLLRKEYLAAVKTNMRATLDRVVIQEEDGSLTPLQKKPCGHHHQHHHHHGENCGCGCGGHHHDHDEKIPEQ